MGITVNLGLAKSFVANEAITLGKFVKLDTDGGILVAGAAEPYIGVSIGGYYVKQSGTTTEDQVYSGNQIDVALRNSSNIVRMNAGAAIVPGVLLNSDANGDPTTHSVSSATYDDTGALALSAASASGEEVKVLL